MSMNKLYVVTRYTEDGTVSPLSVHLTKGTAEVACGSDEELAVVPAKLLLESATFPALQSRLLKKKAGVS